MSSGPNLFARLHKWAIRQDENFLTESLAVVLEQLLVLAPAVSMRLISRLTGDFIEPNPEAAGTIVIRTQVAVETGRPDLEISVPDRLVWTEVKAEADLRTGQLEGYRILLRECGVGQTRLVLLTRYPQVFRPEDTRPDLEVRWLELADWFESELPAAEAAGELSGFLMRQFLDFLKERNMTLTHVDKYMPEGLRALSSLLNMLFEVAAACKTSPKKAAAWDYIGLSLERNKYWVGLYYEAPEELVFETVHCRINPEAATRLGVGESDEENWWRGVELDSEPVHFFSRDKVSQMRWLQNFLRECLDTARSIETADQPPIPEEPEGT